MIAASPIWLTYCAAYPAAVCSALSTKLPEAKRVIVRIIYVLLLGAHQSTVFVFLRASRLLEARQLEARQLDARLGEMGIRFYSQAEAK